MITQTPLRISFGEVFMISRLFKTPIKVTAIVTTKGTAIMGYHEIVKGILKEKVDNRNAPRMESATPEMEPNIPKIKYSTAVILKICLLSAPIVLSMAFSCNR